MSIEELKKMQESLISKQKKYAQLFILLGSITMIWFVLLLVIIETAQNYILFTLLYLFLLISIILLIVVIIRKRPMKEETKQFRKEFKRLFVTRTLQKYFTNLVYLPEQGFDKEYLQFIGMLNTGDEYESNDYVSGDYHNIHLNQSDIKIRKWVRSGDDNVLKTIFKGRWMIFDFNKEFKSTLQACHNFEAAVWPKNEENQLTNLEDDEFNKMFTIMAENEHDAFYILTPHFMEKMKKLAQKYDSGIMFCFTDNRLHIAINNRDDAFEFKEDIPIDENQIDRLLSEDIKIILEMIDELGLDHTIFK